MPLSEHSPACLWADRKSFPSFLQICISSPLPLDLMTLTFPPRIYTLLSISTRPRPPPMRRAERMPAVLHPDAPLQVLLINPEMPESFWTFRQFCRLGGTEVLQPPLALITVAALLPQHWRFTVVDLNLTPRSAIDWDGADLVMLTGMLVQRPGLLSLIREAKRRGKPVAVGGPYATSLSQEVLDAGCDFLIRGEGENTIPLFLQALARGDTRGVFEHPDKPDLSTSPIPRFDLLKMQQYSCMSIQTSRGCPYDCDFCDVISLFGRKVRHKSPEQVIAELETLFRLGWNRSVFISDDNFIGHKAYAKGLLAQMIAWHKERREPFFFWTQTSIDLGQDPELIDLMTLANFNSVFIGIETPDEQILADNRKYQNIRNSLMDSVANIQANGLGVVGSFILGFDGEQAGAGDRVEAFVEAADIPVVMLNLLTPLPNTRLWQRLEQEGRLRPERQDEPQRCHDNVGQRPIFQPLRPEAELVGEYVRLWDELYEPGRFLARVYRNFLAMRPTRAAQAANGHHSRPAKSSRRRASLRQKAQDAISLGRLCWRLGVVASCRWQFWRQLIGIRRRNPSRLINYLVCLGMGDDLFRLRDLIRQNLTAGSCG